jgi:hypothetical protein
MSDHCRCTKAFYALHYHRYFTDRHCQCLQFGISSPWDCPRPDYHCTINYQLRYILYKKMTCQQAVEQVTRIHLFRYIRLKLRSDSESGILLLLAIRNNIYFNSLTAWALLIVHDRVMSKPLILQNGFDILPKEKSLKKRLKRSDLTCSLQERARRV